MTPEVPCMSHKSLEKNVSQGFLSTAYNSALYLTLEQWQALCLCICKICMEWEMLCSNLSSKISLCETETHLYSLFSRWQACKIAPFESYCNYTLLCMNSQIFDSWQVTIDSLITCICLGSLWALWNMLIQSIILPAWSICAVSAANGSVCSTT